MILGTVPLLTKGPFALFLGGEIMLDILDDGPPGKAGLLLIIFTVIFQVFISVFKKYKNNNYAQNLRKSLVENVLNIYGLVVILVFNTSALIYILRKACNISKNILSLLIQLFISVTT